MRALNFLHVSHELAGALTTVGIDATGGESKHFMRSTRSLKCFKNR